MALNYVLILTRHNFFLRIIVFIGLVLGVYNSGYAQSPQFQFDHNKPIEITADSLIVTDNQKTGEFIGNVQIIQDQYRLTANRIIIEYSDKKKDDNIVKKITAYKNVYLFTNNQKAANAQKMTYDLYSKNLILSDNVLLTYDGNILKGETITLNTQTRFLKVEGGKQKRVKAFINAPAR